MMHREAKPIVDRTPISDPVVVHKFLTLGYTEKDPKFVTLTQFAQFWKTLTQQERSEYAAGARRGMQ